MLTPLFKTNDATNYLKYKTSLPWFQPVFQPQLDSFYITGVSPLFTGDTFQDPPVDAETEDTTKPYTYYVFSYTYITMIKFNV